MTQKQLWTLAGALLGSALMLLVLLLFQGRDSAEPVNTTTPSLSPAPKANPYAWPEPTADPWPVPAKTFGTKEQAAKAVAEAMFDPKAPRLADLVRIACRDFESYADFRFGFDSTWRSSIFRYGTDLPNVSFADYPAMIPNVDDLADMEWKQIDHITAKHKTYSATLSWSTKPEIEKVGRVSVSFLLATPTAGREAWCLRGVTTGAAHAR